MVKKNYSESIFSFIPYQSKLSLNLSDLKKIKCCSPFIAISRKLHETKRNHIQICNKRNVPETSQTVKGAQFMHLLWPTLAANTSAMKKQPLLFKRPEKFLSESFHYRQPTGEKLRCWAERMGAEWCLETDLAPATTACSGTFLLPLGWVFSFVFCYPLQQQSS